jgi:hypothetical protein
MQIIVKNRISGVDSSFDIRKMARLEGANAKR